MYSSSRNYLEYLAAALFSFYNVFQFALLNTINSQFSAALHVTSVQMGWFASCHLWANALSLIPMGFYSIIIHYVK